MSALLEARNISFAYTKGKPILDNFSLSVEAGERVALTGPSGKGKSTLAQILSGFLRPDSGEILFDGKPLPEEGHNPVQLIYQHPEKAVNPRWKLGRILAEGWNPSDAFLAEAGIEKEWLKRYPLELSGGEIQRFCIARALGPQTQLVLADEISVMLDVISQAQIWNMLLGLA
ncbi:MAG: ATP-binding cassette domain-containing protein, partial [Treponema sp.]|nr:ATP-binding cassette domain-containing protein [Treponema sp.]